MLCHFVRVRLTNSQLNELPEIPFVANCTVGARASRPYANESVMVFFMIFKNLNIFAPIIITANYLSTRNYDLDQ